MTKDRQNACRQLNQLADALAHDLDQLPDDALLREAADHDADPSRVVSETRELIEAAITAHRKRRLMTARHGYEAETGKARLNVVLLAPERKQALINRFAGDDHQLREKLTMAARNEDYAEVDIDSFLEDLVELGVIDDEGNVL